MADGLDPAEINYLPGVAMASASDMTSGEITTAPKDPETAELHAAAQAYALANAPVYSTEFDAAYAQMVTLGGQDLVEACKSQCRYQSTDCAAYLVACVQGAIDNPQTKMKVMAEWRVHLGDDVRALERAVAADTTDESKSDETP